MKQTTVKIHPLPDDAGAVKKEVGQLSVDIYQTDKEIVILAPIAGLAKDELKVAVTDDVLVIQGERIQKETVPEDNYYTKECFWGKFSRSIVLPENIDKKGITADFENNILEVRVPKSVEERTKIIKIKA